MSEYMCVSFAVYYYQIAPISLNMVYDGLMQVYRTNSSISFKISKYLISFINCCLGICQSAKIQSDTTATLRQIYERYRNN